MWSDLPSDGQMPFEGKVPAFVTRLVIVSDCDLCSLRGHFATTGMSNSKRRVLPHQLIDSHIPVYSSLWRLQDKKKEEEKKGAKKNSKASGEEKENNEPALAKHAADLAIEVHPMDDACPV